MFVLKYGEQPTRCNPILVSMLVEDYDAMIGFSLYKVTWNKEDPRTSKVSYENEFFDPPTHAACPLHFDPALSDLGPGWSGEICPEHSLPRGSHHIWRCHQEIAPRGHSAADRCRCIFLCYTSRKLRFKGKIPVGFSKKPLSFTCHVYSISRMNLWLGHFQSNESNRFASYVTIFQPSVLKQLENLPLIDSPVPSYQPPFRYI